MSWRDANWRGVGRLNRLGLLQAQLFSALIAIVVSSFAAALMWAFGAHEFAVAVPGIGLLAGQVYLIPPSVRRLHDLGLSGYWLLLSIALNIVAVAAWLTWPTSPLALLAARSILVSGAAMALCLFLAPGQQGENRYGSQSRGERQ